MMHILEKTYIMLKVWIILKSILNEKRVINLINKEDIVMLNFTVGPVMSDDDILSIGSEQVPYFRTPEFSNLMLENERLIKKFSKASEDSRAVFITGSGTASMEAVIMNCFNENDKVLIVNGGSFGHRFVELCQIHHIPYDEILCTTGKTLRKEQLERYDGKKYSGFLVNVHETSTGVHYDMNMISDFCKKNRLFLVVDAISSFLADDFDMENLGVDVMITGSQKALACPPGISIVVLSKNAETQKIQSLAEDFREKIKDLPLEIVSDSMSNAVTPLHPLNVSAYDVFTILKDEYNIWVCPNGGELADKIFRVGHIGALTKEDNTTLINALHDLVNRGLL